MRECAPVALAAVTGEELRSAARLLWGVRRAWGLGGARGGRPSALPTWGVPPLALGDALVRLGWGVELWRGEGGGTLVADRTMYPGLLARLAHARLRGGDGDGEGGEGPDVEGLAPLSAWRARMRAGFWIYTVLPEGGAADGHVVATWGEKVLAGNGDGRYDEAPVWQGLRALRPADT